MEHVGYDEDIIVTSLHNAALSAVKRAQYPAAPEGLIEDKYRFQIPIKMSRN